MKNNWSTKKLGEVLEYEQPGKYIVSSKNYSSEYKTPVLTAGKTFILGNTNEKKNIFPADKLPVIIFDDFTTAIKFVDFPFKVKSSAMKILHVKKDEADINYLFYLLQTIKVNHATHKRYWISEYSIKEISLPPLPEQKKIVARLEKALAKIKEAKRLCVEAQELTQNLLSAELHKIFTEGRKRGWEEKNVEDISDDVQYGYTASAKSNGNAQMLRITDIQNGFVNWDNVPFCKCEELEKYKLYDGDIVFARTGATVGKSYLINNPPNNSVFASYLIRVKTNSKKCSPELLYYFFQSSDYWDQVTEQQVGGAQPNVNGSKLKKIKIFLPPLSEQKKIVARLDGLQEKTKKLKEHQKSTATDLDRLEQSILHEAFGG